MLWGVLVSLIGYGGISDGVFGGVWHSLAHWVIILLTVTLITLLIVLGGVVISERYLNPVELDYLNGVSREHYTCSEGDSSRVCLNCNGIFFKDSNGSLVKLSDSVEESVRVELREYYQLSEVCLVYSVREYLVYNGSGYFINKFIEKCERS